MLIINNALIKSGYFVLLITFVVGCKALMPQDETSLIDPPFHHWFHPVDKDTLCWVMPTMLSDFDTNGQDVRRLLPKEKLLLKDYINTQLLEQDRENFRWLDANGTMVYANYAVPLSRHYNGYIIAIRGEAIEPQWICWIYSKVQQQLVNYHTLSTGRIVSESGHHFERSYWIRQTKEGPIEWFKFHHSYRNWSEMQYDEKGELLETEDGAIVQFLMTHDTTHQGWYQFSDTAFSPMVLCSEQTQTADAHTVEGKDTIIMHSRIYLDWNQQWFNDSSAATQALQKHKALF